MESHGKRDFFKTPGVFTAASTCFLVSKFKHLSNQFTYPFSFILIKRKKSCKQFTSKNPYSLAEIKKGNLIWLR